MQQIKQKYLYLTQIIILLIGNIVAWWEVFNSFNTYCGSGGSLRELNFYGLTNPIATPCFYGAIAFLLGLVWSIQVYRKKAQQKHLNYLLVFGTLFAWINTGYTFYKYNTGSGTNHFGCTLDQITNPFTTACFYGAVIFLLALVTGFIIQKRTREDTKED